MNTDPLRRIVPVDETLRRVLPLRHAVGVTRLADVTGLDTLGVPVFCAVRPRGRLLAVSAGKGLTREQAMVGALMEAFELHHAENPPTNLRIESLDSLRVAGERAVDPHPVTDPGVRGYASPRRRVPWALATDLWDGRDAWVPASSTYLLSLAPSGFDSNGLAGGNDLEDATLHALLELVERDAVSSLEENGTVRFAKCGLVVRHDSIPAGVLRQLLERFERVGVQAVLIWIPSRMDVPTFLCVLLEDGALAATSMVRLGSAAHLDPESAAVRAVLEAAQKRLSAIHGGREDMHGVSFEAGCAQRKLLHYFRSLPPNAAWSEFEPTGTGTLAGDIGHLLERLWRAGLRDVYRIDLTRAPLDIPVVKLIVPGLHFNPCLF